jgi:serine/threonine-protein kinase
VGDQIGRGGCGVVLAGVHRKLKRPVAIKQIPQQFAADPDVRRRFAAEARLMASLDHPHVTSVYDYVEDDDLCLLVMEYLPGGTVEKRFATAGFNSVAALAVALSCAAGLEAAHQAGILHRDIKPSNLMFSASGALKITDFGIAKIIGGDDTLLTRAGEVLGTPAYIAPEQARGLELSPATDVYALATMLYRLLSGDLPFPRGADPMAVMFMHAYDAPRPLVDLAPTVPIPIADVVMRGLATDPHDRYRSAEEFGIALADPAAALWGADWLGPVGIPVIGSDSILAAASGGGNRVAATAVLSTATSTLSSAPAMMPIRPTAPIPVDGADLVNVDRNDIVAVRDVVRARSPRVPWTVCTVLALSAIAVAWLGIGSHTRGGDLKEGNVTVAGVDPASAREVVIDMSKPIPVTVAAPGVDAVGLSMSVGGLQIANRTVPLNPQQPMGADVPQLLNPYLVAGTSTGGVTLLQHGTATAHYTFGMRSTQRSITTAVALGAVVAALFAVAHVESCLRALRRRRSLIAAGVGLPAAAAVLGVVLALTVWVLLGREPTAASLVGAAALAAASGVTAVVGARRSAVEVRTLRLRLTRR